MGGPLRIEMVLPVGHLGLGLFQVALMVQHDRTLSQHPVTSLDGTAVRAGMFPTLRLGIGFPSLGKALVGAFVFLMPWWVTSPGIGIVTTKAPRAPRDSLRRLLNVSLKLLRRVRGARGHEVEQLRGVRDLLEVDLLDGVGRLMVVGVEAAE